MSKIEELIEKLCPNGVEYKPIETLVNYEQPTNYIVKSTKYDDTYAIPVLTAGQTFVLGYTNETDGIYDATKYNPVIIFDDFTAGYHWVDFNFKIKSSAMKIIKPKPNVNFRYFYHLMGMINYSSSEHTRLWISTYSQIEVPVPPMEVQCEIVKVLDNFTELTAELTAELQLRRKQYEFYRNDLLTFESENTKIEELCKIAEISTGSNNTEDAVENGEFSFYVRSQDVLKSTQYEFDEEAIITAGDGVGVGKVFHYVNGKYALHQRAYRIHPCKNNINGRYLFHYIVTKFPSYIMNKMFEGSVPSIRRPMLNEFKVSIPSLEVQEKIVYVLDNFDKICSDLKIGLPAEIEARQKQYEYYREKLLNFAKFAGGGTH